MGFLSYISEVRHHRILGKVNLSAKSKTRARLSKAFSTKTHKQKIVYDVNNSKAFSMKTHKQLPQTGQREQVGSHIK